MVTWTRKFHLSEKTAAVPAVATSALGVLVVAGCSWAFGTRLPPATSLASRSMESLVLVLPASKATAASGRGDQGVPAGRRSAQALLPAPAGYQVEISAADLPAPIVSSATVSADPPTLRVDNAPAGANRVIAVQGQDSGGNPIPGALWMAVAQLDQASTTVVLDPQSTAVGEVYARWLQSGQLKLASTASPSSVASGLDAVMSAQGLPNYGFVDSQAWADAVAAASGSMNVGTAFFTRPGQAWITLQGAPADVPATLWVDDPASPEQTGLSDSTSGTNTYLVSPIVAGTWTAWASVPGLGLASASLTVDAGGTASASLNFAGWNSGPALPVPTGNAAIATDGRFLYVVGGVLAGGATTAAAWELDTSEASPSWSALPDFPSAREGACAAVWGQTLFLVGGQSGTDDFDDLWSLNLKDPSGWVELPGTSAPDGDFTAHPGVPLAAIASGSDLLALWTFNDDQDSPPFAQSHLASFAPSSSTWTYDPGGMPSMESPRQRAGVAAFDGNIVVAGGDREQVDQGLSLPGGVTPAVTTVEALAGGRWSAWPDLPAGRSELALAQGGPDLYAAGGVDDLEVPQTEVYRFDSLQRAWQPAPPLGQARSAFGLVYAGGRLWAIGGSPAHQANEDDGTALALASVETLVVPPGGSP